MDTNANTFFLGHFIVSANEPYTILETKAQGRILGYEALNLCGQGVHTLCGPWTDSLLLFSIISEALVMKSNSVRLVLKDRLGRKQWCTVKCLPALGFKGQLEGCSVIIEGENQDHCFKKSNHFQNVVAASNNTCSGYYYVGLCETGKLETCTQECEGVHNSKHFDEQDNSRSIAISRLISSPEKSLRIVPRQKRTTLTSESHALGPGHRRQVVLNLDIVKSLQLFPLVRAAAAVGLSPTAFKRACLQLGIARWAGPQ